MRTYQMSEVKIPNEKSCQSLITYLHDHEIFFKENYLIKYDTYFKMGGKVKIFISPQVYEKFKETIIFLNHQEIEYKVIGHTSNIWLFDEIEYSVIVSTRFLTSVVVSPHEIAVEAGYSLQDFVRVAAINNSAGFEGLEGIPGSIGGALFMNAGAYGYAISDNLIAVECIDEHNEIISLSKADCLFEYRSSIFKYNDKYVILKAIFRFQEGDSNHIAKNIEKYHIARHSYQEFVYPNLGSMVSLDSDIYNQIFKNDIAYNILYKTIKLLFKNPVSKFIMRKRPHNIIPNTLFKHFFQSKLKNNLSHNLSPKSANILINDGSNSTNTMIDYIFLVSELVGEAYHIENELVIAPAIAVHPDFQNTYQKINQRLSSNYDRKLT